MGRWSYMYWRVKGVSAKGLEPRISAEVLRVITAGDEQSRKPYPQTLFSAQEAHIGPCTAKTTIYCANIAAGFMLAQFTKYLHVLLKNS